ncbi:unnamed protein product [Rodentolepis nana]|uniref:Glycerophosphocholine phosphodiesterase n=1 Tax=Rodentolepis nana TaxID=102285 RepID=A0A0R3TNB4_RODNA|nr:unnamed protein product [Rodentolepis nana]
MQKTDLTDRIPFSVIVDCKALEKLCVYVCNTDTFNSSRYFAGIVGNHPDFGNWNPLMGKPCKFRAQKMAGSDLWSLDVPKDVFKKNFKYRFYVAEKRTDPDQFSDDKKIIILAWESRLKPREFNISSFNKGELEMKTVKFGKYENGTFIQRGYLINHSEVHVRLPAAGLKLSRNALSYLSSSTRDLTKLVGQRIYVTCRQSVMKGNDLINALEGEIPIYPDERITTKQNTKSSSHIIYSEEPNLANEIHSQQIDPSLEFPDDYPPKDSSGGSQAIPIRGNLNSAFSIPVPRRCEFSVSPISSHNSTCPSTPRSTSPAPFQNGEPPVLVSVLAKERCTRRLPEHTGCWGTLYSGTEDVFFYLEVLNCDDVAIQLEFFIEVVKQNGSKNDGKEDEKLPPVVSLGTAWLGPFTDYWGHKRIQLLNHKSGPIGDVKISYMVINPIVGGAPPKFDVSYKHYWKKRDALDIGHRGMGTYYLSKKEKDAERPAPIKENTLGSFQTAVKHGADFVEMDVQLTKDHMVVVYHDFETVITPRKKKKGQLTNFPVPVKDLPFEYLRELRLQHATVLTEPQTDEDMDREDSDPVELQDFPLLRQCLQEVDPELGFDIEVKYPLDFKSGGSEMSNFFERNFYIDTILREIFKYCGNRRILFSCFDPDTCAMLQAKQIRFPVFQLGVCPEYKDVRHGSFDMLCYSAKANELLGVAANSDEFLRKPDRAGFARELGLIVLVWGTASNDSKNMEQLKKLGVRGLIYDRMQEHKQLGTVSMLKKNKSAKNADSDDDCNDHHEAERSNSNRSTASPSPPESGTSTPSHHGGAKPDCLDLEALSESLSRQLLPETTPSRNGRRLTLTTNFN